MKKACSEYISIYNALQDFKAGLIDAHQAEQFIMIAVARKKDKKVKEEKEGTELFDAHF